MKNSVRTILFIALSAGLSFNALANSDTAAQHSHSPENSAQQTVINTKGIVKEIDTTAKKVTITHEAIPSINWPAMTMRFTYEVPSMIEKIKVNDLVTLDFIQQGNLSLLTNIEITK